VSSSDQTQPLRTGHGDMASENASQLQPVRRGSEKKPFHALQEMENDKGCVEWMWDEYVSPPVSFTLSLVVTLPLGP